MLSRIADGDPDWCTGPRDPSGTTSPPAAGVYATPARGHGSSDRPLRNPGYPDDPEDQRIVLQMDPEQRQLYDLIR